VVGYLLISSARALLTLLAVSLLVFAMARLTGNPLDVLLPNTASAADRLAMAHLWGLDRSYPEQYVTFLTNALTGDFGSSLKWSGQSALGVVLGRIPITLEITLPATVLMLLIAVPLGIASAVRRGSWVDSTARAVALLGQSLPTFWLAIMPIWLFAVGLGWLPTSGNASWTSAILPTVVIATFGVAAFTRLIRSSMLEVLDTEYIKLARLKGLPEYVVIWKHALRNAAIAPLTLFGTIVVNLITGSVVVETIFAWPGVGQLALDATTGREVWRFNTVPGPGEAGNDTWAGDSWKARRDSNGLAPALST